MATEGLRFLFRFRFRCLMCRLMEAHYAILGQYHQQSTTQYMENHFLKALKYVLNMLNMGRMGSRGLGPWAQGPQGHKTKSCQIIMIDDD